MDHILHFLVGALNPVFIIISATTPWSAIWTPIIALGMLYGGCMNLIALRKQLNISPIGLGDLPPPPKFGKE